MSRHYVLPGWLIVTGIIAAYKYGKHKAEAKLYKEVLDGKYERKTATAKSYHEDGAEQDDTTEPDEGPDTNDNDVNDTPKTDDEVERYAAAAVTAIREAAESINERIRRRVNANYNSNER